MASKNMTIMVLYLTFNLVFLGFSSAQSPVAQPPACPLTTSELAVCINLLSIIRISLTPRIAADCCNLLAGVGGPNATVCACEAARENVLGLGLGLNVRVGQLLRVCPAVPLPPGGVSCN